MRTRVQCNCGWQRELSGFYAGKRIRCADCMAIIDVPGSSAAGAYLYPPMIEWPAGRHVKPRGRWVPITGAQAGPCATPEFRRQAEACRRRGVIRSVLVAALSVPLALLLAMYVLGGLDARVQPVHCDTPATASPEAPTRVDPAPAERKMPEPDNPAPAMPQEPPKPASGQADPDAEQEDEF